MEWCHFLIDLGRFISKTQECELWKKTERKYLIDFINEKTLEERNDFELGFHL